MAKSLATRKSLSTHLQRHTFDRAMAGEADCYAGVDEVGRGCLAGPVVAAAVIPPPDISEWYAVEDSKRLSEQQREALAQLVLETAIGVGIGIADVREIDELNILRATQLAMGRALSQLSTVVELVLVDGNHAAATRLPCLPVVQGDSRSLAIAAASIVAKVHRDTYMKTLDTAYPAYGFSTNVGYGTKQHLAALQAYGPTPHHRLTFAPVRQAGQRQTELAFHG